MFQADHQRLMDFLRGALIVGRSLTFITNLDLTSTVIAKNEPPSTNSKSTFSNNIVLYSLIFNF